MGEIWDLIGSNLASILFIWAMVQKFCPYQVHEFIKKISNKLASLFDPYVEVRFFEYIGDFRKTNEAFSSFEHYLTFKSNCDIIITQNKPDGLKIERGNQYDRRRICGRRTQISKRRQL